MEREKKSLQAQLAQQKLEEEMEEWRSSITDHRKMVRVSNGLQKQGTTNFHFWYCKSIIWVQLTFWYARCDLELWLKYIKSVSELGENAYFGMH